MDGRSASPTPLRLDRAGQVAGQRAVPGDHPLHTPAQAGDVFTLGALLQRGVPPSLSNARDASPLPLAAENRQVAACRQLLQAGANNEVRSANGLTALYMAIARRHRVVVHVLLAAGASASVHDGEESRSCFALPCIWMGGR